MKNKKIEEILAEKEHIENANGFIGYTEEVIREAVKEYVSQIGIWVPMKDSHPEKDTLCLVIYDSVPSFGMLDVSGKWIINSKVINDPENISQWIEVNSNKPI